MSFFGLQARAGEGSSSAASFRSCCLGEMGLRACTLCQEGGAGCCARGEGCGREGLEERGRFCRVKGGVFITNGIEVLLLKCNMIAVCQYA